ncbi:thiamine phosphate synthase [Krasilnikovia sp. M28-CT-15]|uniref:thiamine phosphate synthase n=1 Tax=Krasilnikovia sp. M28-CT-15 TaxID=3373540 RepID=UPI0038777CEF
MGSAFPRLHVITDARPGRDALGVVTAAVSAAIGYQTPDALAVQVRVEDDVTDRAAYEFGLAVARICRPAGVMFLVNDRLDVAVAVDADGAHVGADDLPVPAARAVLGPAAVLGATCREPVSARAAVAAGATYLGVGPAFRTSTKAGLPEPLGAAGVAAVAEAVGSAPVIAIGGVSVDEVGELRARGAYGVAVVGALAVAADPEATTTALLKALA